MKAFFRFVLVVLLLVGVAMVSAIVTMHFAIHGAEVSIPDFKGMTVAEAGRRAAGLGLTLQVESHLYSSEVPVARVANQSPVAGTIVRRGWRVWLTESLGPQKLAIPDVMGKDQRFATIAIRRAGFQLGTIAEMPWPAAQPGMVIAQSPDSNASGVESPTMNLLVAAQPDEGTPAVSGYVMPNLEGQIFTAAALAVTRMGLKLAQVKEEDVHVTPPGPTGTAIAPVIPPGAVVDQSPAAGSRVDATIPVQLTVAR